MIKYIDANCAVRYNKSVLKKTFLLFDSLQIQMIGEEKWLRLILMEFKTVK